MPFHEGWPWRRASDGRTALEVIPRWLRWGVGGILLLMTVSCMMVRSAGDDPDRWHVDPAAAERTGNPNDFLMAPDGAAAAEADMVSPVWDTTPEALMARLDAVAMAEPRVERIAGSAAEAHVTWVQRSAVWGFPDYVSAKAVGAEGGAALVIWSRARYGYSDLGVNEARVRRWVGALD